MKRRLLRWGAVALLLGLGGFLVAASGIVPIKASSGHWPVTAWFLHFAMRRSIATHSLGIEAPPPEKLQDPALVLKGAGHYEGGCLPCHGGPGSWQPRIPQQMTPHPPSLPEQIRHWKPEELFYVVKHGIKFTGMPAWPALERDDEVWAVVAFLRALPDLDAAGYRRLVWGEAAAASDLEIEARSVAAGEGTGEGAAGETAAAAAAAVREGAEAGEGGQVPAGGLGVAGLDVPPGAVMTTCRRCHGEDGAGRGEGAFPRLAGQRPDYLAKALRAYAAGRRKSGVMQPMAAALSDETVDELAAYYAGLAIPRRVPPAPARPPDPAAVARGEAIARDGVPAARVPACSDCHGPSPTRRNPAYPRLAGQYADYLVLQLELFKQGKRGGSAYAHLMDKVAPRLTPEQIRDVAGYYASLPPEG